MLLLQLSGYGVIKTEPGKHFKINFMEQIKLEKNVLLEFKPEQIALIINVLREQPYKLVIELLNSIETQIIKQMTPEA